jgi:DNA-binding transcriptional regulator YdaS (Cro superfamily)
MAKHPFAFPETIGQIAQMVGIHRQGLSRILHRHVQPSPSLARKIEFATKGIITAASLLGLEDVPSLQPRKHREVKK